MGEGCTRIINDEGKVVFEMYDPYGGTSVDWVSAEYAIQNEMLRDTKRFIEALNGLKKHVAVTASNIIAGTSNLVGYDMRKQEYEVNHNLVRGLRGS